MKMVIVRDYADYTLTLECLAYVGTFDESEVEPNDPKLIEFIEENGINATGTGIKLVEIPNNATDWEIEEEDGEEFVKYVFNGQMYLAEEIA